jgi:hypothetical protein
MLKLPPCMACLPAIRFSGRRKGYVFLMSVLSIGAIATATAVSMILLGLASQQSGATVVSSSQAWEHAQTCVERALRELRSDVFFSGNTTYTLTNGSCRLLPIGGSDVHDRTICAEGTSDTSVRRVQVYVAKLLPTTIIRQWEEVHQFTYCD